MKKIKQKKQIKSRRNLFNTLAGTKKAYYISVFRSNKHLYVSLHDVKTKKVLYGASDKSLDKELSKKNKVTKASQLGVLFAEKMKKNNHLSAVFFRGPYSYLGRIKAFVESLRKEGIQI